MSILFRYQTKRSSMLGIDIRAGAVCVLGMSMQDEQSLVTGWGYSPLTEDHFDGETIKNLDGLAASIQDALLKAHLKDLYATIALPQEKVTIKILPFSAALHEKELESFILIKIAPYLSYPLSETYMDFAILGESVTPSGMQDVLVIAAHKDGVDSRVEALGRAGLRVQSVDVDVFAAERCLNWLQEEEISEGQGIIKKLMNHQPPHGFGKYSSAFITACGLALKGQDRMNK